MQYDPIKREKMKCAAAEKYAKSQQPSSGVPQGKACKILHEGTAQGHDLTEQQRKMFGAACSKNK